MPLINVLESHQFLILSWGAIYNLMKESDLNKPSSLAINKFIIDLNNIASSVFKIDSNV